MDTDITDESEQQKTRGDYGQSFSKRNPHGPFSFSLLGVLFLPLWNGFHSRRNDGKTGKNEQG